MRAATGRPCRALSGENAVLMGKFAACSGRPRRTRAQKMPAICWICREFASDPANPIHLSVSAGPTADALTVWKVLRAKAHDRRI